MGRKKDKSYGKEELKFLETFLCSTARKSAPGYSLPEFTIIDLSLLEKAIHSLPKTERKSIETFFGLFPGSINHAKLHKNPKNIATNAQMFSKAFAALKSLCSLEYLYIYEHSSQILAEKISAKIDYANTSISKLDGVKYVLAYFLFLKEGPSMFYDTTETTLDFESDKTLSIDDLSFLNMLWMEYFSFLPDNDFKLDMVIQRINTSLDLTTTANIFSHVKLDFPSNLQDYVPDKPFMSFWDIRQFKEKYFSAGPWLLFDSLVCKSSSEGVNMETLSYVLRLYQKGLLGTLKTTGFLPVKLSYGEVKYPVYKKDRIAFIDPEEIDFIYLNRDLI